MKATTVKLAAGVDLSKSLIAARSSLFMTGLYDASKRLFDILLATILLVLLFVPMMVIAVCVRVDSPGEIIFRQERLGKDGVAFVIYKFRSMRIDAEDNGPRWAKENDPRCTKVGTRLRLSRLDELPQLVNILKGEMSFVGPRPERECFYIEFEKTIPGFSKRLAVKPGLTGLAQVMGGYELAPKEKLAYDMQYIAERSPMLDIKCLLMTPKIMFTHDGAH
ncbi:MAG: sugar transferase [Christensenellaceae bacterium]|nr:sugar transferase [Christensenellaceae bacterium]